MDFITKDQWGASPKTATRSTHPIGRTRGVKLHWGGGRKLGITSHDQCGAILRRWERYHEGRGWADLAYNLAACGHGYVFEGRGAGVRSSANGNRQLNDDHYAVVYIGSRGDPFTEGGKRAFVDAVQYLRREGAGPEVLGHRDGRSTDCPGDDIYRWLHATNFDEEEDMALSDEDVEKVANAVYLRMEPMLNMRDNRVRDLIKGRFAATDADIDQILAELDEECSHG